MRRITDILSISLMMVGVASVYSFKEETLSLSRQATELRQGIKKEQILITELKAQWEEYIEPRRIDKIAMQNLELTVPKARHYVDISQIPLRPKSSVLQKAGEADDIASIIDQSLDAQTTSSIPDEQATGAADPIETLLMDLSQ